MLSDDEMEYKKLITNFNHLHLSKNIINIIPMEKVKEINMTMNILENGANLSNDLYYQEIYRRYKKKHNDIVNEINQYLLNMTKLEKEYYESTNILDKYLILNENILDNKYCGFRYTKTLNDNGINWEINYSYGQGGNIRYLFINQIESKYILYYRNIDCYCNRIGLNSCECSIDNTRSDGTTIQKYIVDYDTVINELNDLYKYSCLYLYYNIN